MLCVRDSDCFHSFSQLSRQNFFLTQNEIPFPRLDRLLTTDEFDIDGNLNGNDVEGTTILA
jgi:hypothetical protein